MPDASSQAAFTVDGDLFQMLMNEAGQYSLWPAALPVPEGWARVAALGSKAECVAYVDAHWTAMRPHSLDMS